MPTTVSPQMWQRYIEDEIGFVLPKTQGRWLKNAILATAHDSNVTVAELWLAVQSNVGLRQKLLDNALITESRFFRHLPSLAFITELAQLAMTPPDGPLGAATTKSQSPFNIWSVGCAGGQEVWSLAMMLDHSQIANFNILGSDVSSKAIKVAQKARYSLRDKTSVLSQYQAYLYKLRTMTTLGVASQSWQVVDSLRSKAVFKHHNALSSMPPTTSKQNVIICQNMLIYFRPQDQQKVLARLVEQCESGGHLVLAPGEALFWQHPQMRRVIHPQVNAWQKI